MTSTEMNRIVAEELAHIPRRRDVDGEPIEQSLLRAAYNAHRLADLKRDPGTPRRATLERARAAFGARTRRIPVYDDRFFGV